MRQNSQSLFCFKIMEDSTKKTNKIKWGKKQTALLVVFLPWQNYRGGLELIFFHNKRMKGMILSKW